MRPARERGGFVEQASLLGWALVAGTLGAAPALLFRWAANAVPALAWPPAEDLVQAVARAPVPWRLLVPPAGLFLAGLALVAGERWAGLGRGWDILEAVRLKDGVLPLRATAVRAASSLLTVASAGPVGREGAIVLLPAAVTSALGRRARLPTRRLRVAVGCGAAAGLACAYNAPIGAALFTMEIIFGSFALEIFAPLVVASAAATLLSHHFFGAAPLFAVPALELTRAPEIAGVAALGVLAGLLSAGFLWALRAASALWRTLAWPRPLAMAAAGLAVGVAVLRYPEIVGNGREAVLHLFASPVGAGTALALLLVRLVATPLTVGAGTVGGVFTPTMFLGAMLGTAFGWGLSALFPSAGVDPRTWALVGMGAFLAGTTHAPLTAAVMVFEMTLDYGVALPLLVGSGISALVATRLAADSVYTEALRRGGDEGPPAGRSLLARDVMRAEQLTVAPDLELPPLLDLLVGSRRNHAYVVDPSGRFLGAVSLHDAVRAAGEAGRDAGLRAADVLEPRFEATFPDEPLERVLERLARQSCERIPVLADRDSRRLLGTVSRRDILGLYGRELVAARRGT